MKAQDAERPPAGILSIPFPGDPPTQYLQDVLAEAAAVVALIPQLKAGADLYKEFQAAGAVSGAYHPE